MEQIKQTINAKIDSTIFGYESGEFMPIRVDGEIANWDAFAIYKAEKVAQGIGRIARRTAETTANVAGTILHHMMQQSNT